MSILEEKIRKNKKDFDVHEPSDEHFEKFRQKIGEDRDKIGNITFNFGLIWKVAAVILILVAVAVLLPETRQDGSNNVLASMVMDSTNYPEELKEVRQYYQARKENKIQQLEQYSCEEENCSELKELAKEEIGNIEEDTRELEKDFVEGNKDERVYKAIVSNYQLMGEVLDKVIDHLDRSEK